MLVSDDETVGPVRLPMNRVDDFVDHFNRVYAGLGMQIVPMEDPLAPLPSEPNQKDDQKSASENQ